MKPIFTLTAAALAMLSTVAVAQTPADQTSAQANADVAVQADTNKAVATQQNADAMAQYQSDLAAYQQALRDNHRDARQDQRHYDHQQRAYADAMAAWRHQVYACHHGSDRACNAPTPNPADFW